MNAMTRIEQQPLGKMDWRTVEMARQDGPRSLNPDGIVSRIARNLFGIPIPRRLASDQLEALRRFSVRAWFWDYVPASEVQDFLDAGYAVANAGDLDGNGTLDILGSAPGIKSVYAIEAMTGTIYMAVLISRLVALYTSENTVEQKEKQDEDKSQTD